MRDPLANCSYNQVYKNLKEFSQNGENFCKQVTSILQQRANLEFNYAKGLQKLAIKLSKAIQNTKKNCVVSAWAWVSEGMKSAADLHRKLGKAIELEAIKPTHQVLSVHEKKRKSLDNEFEKTANLFISNWNQQIKAKKKLMVSTKKHEALFHLIESSKQTMTEREKQKLLNKLKKSTEKLAKEDENYYQKNIAGCSTRLKWENTLENCYQSILELEKERIKLLCNNLNQYTQHISDFGQTLTTCHSHIHGAISKIDVEKDIQALMEETAVSSTENTSEFLLTDYFEEEPNNAMNKERQKSSIKSKLMRLQRDIEKASRDLEGLQRMLKAYSSNSFPDPESQKSTAALMEENIVIVIASIEYVLGSAGYTSGLIHTVKDARYYLQIWEGMPQRREERDSLCDALKCRLDLMIEEIYSQGQMMYPQTNLKLDLLQANSYKLSSVLAELEQRPQPSHPCSNSIFKQKEKQQTYSCVRISRPFLMMKSGNVVREASSGGQSNPTSSSTASSAAQHSSSLCKALYSFQARQDDELSLEVGDIVTIHKKIDGGWWFGSLNGKKGHFPAAYVEELPSDAGYRSLRQDSQHTTLHTL